MEPGVVGGPADPTGATDDTSDAETLMEEKMGEVVGSIIFSDLIFDNINDNE